MTTIDQKSCEMILNALQKLKSVGPKPVPYDYGICASVTDILRDRTDDLYVFSVWKCLRVEAFRCWVDYSGDHRYPVSSSSRLSAEDQYYEAIETPDGFWGDHPYGDARRRLLDHLIEWFKLNMVACDPS